MTSIFIEPNPERLERSTRFGLEILPTGLGFKVFQNCPFYTTLGLINKI